MGGKTGNRLKGCLYVGFQFYCRGLAPRTPLRFAAGSPQGRRMFAAGSPQGRHIDNRVQCIISVLYVTLLVQREREKERNLASQPGRSEFYLADVSLFVLF